MVSEIGLPSHCAVVEHKIAVREIRGLEIGRTAAQTPLTASTWGRQPCGNRGRRLWSKTASAKRDSRVVAAAPYTLVETDILGSERYER